MKIYVVAHENIVCPKEYRKIEITEEGVEGYIKRSVAYEDMLETLPDMSSIGPVEEDFYVHLYLQKPDKKGIKSPFYLVFLNSIEPTFPTLTYLSTFAIVLFIVVLKTSIVK